MSRTAPVTADDQSVGEEWKTGQVTLVDDEDDEQDATPHARESRSEASNRWVREGVRAEVDRRRDEVRKECLASGMRRHEAVERSWQVVLAEYPPPGTQPQPADDPQPIPEPPPCDPAGSTWLSEIPADWPVLPPNASLMSEVQWVQANRLRVRDGERVDLTRALSPAPSHSALSWLETSILYPAKWADVTVKATASQEDETGATRRERAAVDEVSALLDSTLEELSN
jgi:nitroimidazol reductase NimA-like FMN-containing flavoprotein (pyridoxamine 5'-phosphate oxidase superfamily)